jgi:hypothetical protein
MEINSAERSKILLLCLGLDTDMEDVKKMTVHDLHKIFKIFGCLQKIIIFSKKDILKAFLEYDTFENAELAKDFVHESFMNNYGKARLYYSSMNELRFSNRYLEYWDYAAKDNKTDLSTDIGSQYNIPDFLKKDSIEVIDQDVIDEEGSFESLPLSIDNDFKKSKSFSFAKKNESVKNFTSVDNLPKEEKDQDLQTVKVKPSKVILISNLDNCFKNVEELYNFFCCYGDIKKVLYMINLGKAMIQFTRLKYSAFCVKNINNFPFLKTTIKINYSKYSEINLDNKRKSSNSISFNQTKVISQNENFYQKEIITSSMMPSKTVNIVFDKLCRVNVIDISNYMEIYFPKEKFDISDLSTFQMRKFNIKFHKQEDAIEAILKLNNTDIRNTKMFMYFC